MHNYAYIFQGHSFHRYIYVGSSIDCMHVLVMLYLVMHLLVACTGSLCGGNVGTSDKMCMSAVSLNCLVTLIPVNYMH